MIFKEDKPNMKKTWTSNKEKEARVPSIALHKATACCEALQSMLYVPKHRMVSLKSIRSLWCSNSVERKTVTQTVIFCNVVVEQC